MRKKNTNVKVNNKNTTTVKVKKGSNKVELKATKTVILKTFKVRNTMNSI